MSLTALRAALTKFWQWMHKWHNYDVAIFKCNQQLWLEHVVPALQVPKLQEHSIE